MYGSWKTYTEVGFSLREKKKKSLKNDVNLYWCLHICINASARIIGDAHIKMPMCTSSWSSASFVPSHRPRRGKRAVSGTRELPCGIKTTVSKVGTWASAMVRPRRIVPDPLRTPQQAGMESPAPQKLANYPLVKTFWSQDFSLKTFPAGALTLLKHGPQGFPVTSCSRGARTAELGHLHLSLQVPLFLCCDGGSGELPAVPPAPFPTAYTSLMLFVS